MDTEEARQVLDSIIADEFESHGWWSTADEAREALNVLMAAINGKPADDPS